MGLNIPQIILVTVSLMKDTTDFDGESEPSLSAKQENGKRKQPNSS